MLRRLISSSNKLSIYSSPCIKLQLTRNMHNKENPNSCLDISGIYPPIITPFDNNYNISFENLLFNLGKWKKVNFKGYVLMGSNGEFPFLTQKEKIDLVSFVKKVCGDANKLLVVGTGCETTQETIDLTNKMADIGANAALVVSPFFFKGRMTDDNLYAHYVKVADSSKIPIILYNVPANTGLDLNASLVIKLADHPNIIGLKDSGGDIQKIGQIVHKTKNKNFQVLAGSAGFLYPALCVGCVGGVVALANPLGESVCLLYQHFKNGKHSEAQQLQQRLIGPNLAVTKQFGVPGVKAAMDFMGYKGGLCRPPLKSLKEQELKQVKDEFEMNGFLIKGKL